MAIQILPPQLANQIAAGEVVERPASVVKELVENSLDAGATRIQVEIEKGGAKRIAIRDNGCGISKEDLPLALARHATSKIVTLDDLAAITSLGFRGEALASISSVSRLTLTSRTEQQQEAWQAYAEGREMKILLKPAAHPCGSTLEVLDLFYNTPARRKFLRTEKTEFMQIDEVIRRIALVRFDTDITLIHNGKKVRQYRPANNEQQKVRRLTAICGQAFTNQAVQIEWQHQDLGLTGWIASPQAAGSASELQYCYVNGRMMRDKLISHAIRQAYQDKPGADQLPAYVLFLRIDPHQVDVNVHPAKHEVRFHQSRLVHDFIYQGVLSALQQIEEQGPDGATYTDTDEPRTEPRRQENRQAAGRNMFAESAGSSKKAPATGIPGSIFRPSDADIYQKMMAATAVREPGSGCREIPPDWQAATPPEASQHSFGRVLTVCQQRFAITENAHQLLAVALPMAEQRVLCIRLTPDKEPLKSQPLLIPLRVSLTKEEKQCLLHYHDLLDRFGIQLQYDARHVIISAVPLPLRSRNLQILIPEMLGYFASQTTVNQDAFARWLSVQNLVSSTAWNHSQAITLLADLERLDPSVVRYPPKGLVSPIDLNPVFKMLTDE